MDPKMFRLIDKQLIVMAPALGDEDFGSQGGDDDLGDEEEDPDDDDSDEEEDDDEEKDPDDDDSDEDEDDDEEDLGKLGKRSQKRIKKLLGENKSLKAELEEARKLGGNDGEAILSVATKAGILPRLLTKDLAEKIDRYESKKNALEYMQDLLDDDEQEEFEIGGKTYTRKQVKQRVRALKDEVEELKDDSKKGRQKAIDETRELVELGLAAKKAGWKPGKKGEGEEKGKGKKKAKPGKHKVHKTGKQKRTREVNWGEVDGDDDLEAMIAAQMRKGK